MSPKSVSFQDLAGIAACLALALAAHVGSLPAWVLGTVAVAAALRLGLAYRGQAAPPRAVRLLISGLAIALLFLQFRTFNGVTAGTALLALMAGLKLLETETQRDIYVLTFIIYFLSTAALLMADSFWLLSLSHRGVLADLRHVAALEQRHGAASLAAQPALYRTYPGAGPAARLGVLVVLSALRRPAVAAAG